MQWFDIVKKLGPIKRKDPKTGKMKTIGQISQRGGGSVRGTKSAYVAPTKYSSERATATASSIEQRTEIPRLKQETSRFIEEQKQYQEYTPKWNSLQERIERNRLAIAEAQEQTKDNLGVQQQGRPYKVESEKPKTLTQGVKRILRGPPKKTYTNAEMLARRNQVKNTVNQPVEERQSQKDDVARRIAEERKKQEETVARMREQRQPAGSVKDARRARIVSSGGI